MKFLKIQDGGHTPISVIFAWGSSFITVIMQRNRYPRSTRTFSFPNVVWASASGGFGIVSDTLVSVE